jgi:hypothetical protein
LSQAHDHAWRSSHRCGLCFVGSPFGKAVALLDSLLKEIGCFTHFAITVTKSPASRGPHDA